MLPMSNDIAQAQSTITKKAEPGVSFIDCPNCEKLVEMDVKGVYEGMGSEDPFPCRYTLMRCKKCYRPVLMLQEYTDEYNKWDDVYRLYPPQSKYCNRSIPKVVSDAYTEALTCIKGKAYTAAVIMCRKTIECICHDKKAKGKDLFEQLKYLKDESVIEHNLYDWANALRLLGNDAVHEAEMTFSKQDSVDVIEFTDALLGYVYTFKEKFNKFQARRAKESKC